MVSLKALTSASQILLQAQFSRLLPGNPPMSPLFVYTCDGMRIAFLPPNQDSAAWNGRGHAALDPQSLRGCAFFQETAPNTDPSLPYLTRLCLFSLNPCCHPEAFLFFFFSMPRERCDLKMSKDSPILNLFSKNLQIPEIRQGSHFTKDPK